jgi:hypothetical protein
VPADEVCNHADDDCDGVVDEGWTETWFADADDDTFGDPDTTVEDCMEPAGHVDNGLDCDDTDGRLPALDGTCGPWSSCLEVLQAGLSDGDGLYVIDADNPRTVLCDMTRAGGGWTLALVSADDGRDTWTWDQRDLWTTDTQTLGSLDDLNADFKSWALHEVPMTGLLIEHAPSGVWASYNGVRTPGVPTSLADHMLELGSVCYVDRKGIKLSDGTLTEGGALCSTHLYMSPVDQDGADSCASDDDAWGPAWSASNNSGCPLDDPGLTGFGPNALYPGAEADSSFQGFGAGFGWALGLNTGAPGTGENAVRLWVR